MNLLCPICQKPLTVPEQYAGQLMKCPLCNGTFGVPGLPAPPAPPPPPQEVFRMAAEPPSPPRTEPAAPAVETAKKPKAETPPPAPPPTPGSYERTISCTLNPKILVWIAPAALGLIFLLLFFPWVSTYELARGEWYSQIGWGTGFGAEWNIWGAFYVLLLFPTMALALAVGIAPLLSIKLPPQAEMIWSWRSAIVAAAILLPTLLLVGEMGVFGFGLENVVQTTGDGPPAKDAPDDLPQRLMASAKAREVARETLTGTCWLRLALLMHLVALAGAGLDACIQNRGPSKPLPRMDVMW